jgi:hypothetical protein
MRRTAVLSPAATAPTTVAPFIAIGYDQTLGLFSVASTANGVTWSSASSLSTTSNPNLASLVPNGTFKVGSTYYSLVGPGGSTKYLASTTNWSTFSYSTSTAGLNVNGVGYNGTGVVVGSTALAIKSSANLGTTWSTASSVSGVSIRTAAYGAGTWVAVGQSANTGGGAVAYTNATTDGSGTWTAATTQMTSPSTSYDARHVIYAGGKFVAVGGFTGTATSYTSTNGTTWTSNTIAGSVSSGGLQSVAYDGVSKYVAVGDTSGGTPNLIYSSDGNTWALATAPAILTTNAVSFNSVTYANGYFIAVGDSNTIAYSTNGTSWSVSTTPFATTNTFVTVVPS